MTPSLYHELACPNTMSRMTIAPGLTHYDVSFKEAGSKLLQTAVSATYLTESTSHSSAPCKTQVRRTYTRPRCLQQRRPWLNKHATVRSIRCSIDFPRIAPMQGQPRWYVRCETYTHDLPRPQSSWMMSRYRSCRTSKRGSSPTQTSFEIQGIVCWAQ